jgi:Poxvirus A32 protein
VVQKIFEMEELNADICTLKSPSNFVISGATGSGKTTFLLNLMKSWPFEQKLGSILYFYNTWQPLLETFMSEFPNMCFIQGLHLEKIEDLHADAASVNVVICDDLMDSAVKSEEFARLFTVYGHHKNIINFFITQNPFFKGPLSTTVNRNTHYFVLMKTPHLNTLSILNNQLYGGSGPLKEAYIKAMNEKKHAYLLIDVFSDSIKDRLRSNIMPNESPMIIWRPS